MMYSEMMNRLMSLRTYAILESIRDNMYDGWSQDVKALSMAIDILNKIGNKEGVK